VRGTCLLLLLLAPLPLSAQQTQVRGLPAAANVSIRAYNLAGSIRVIGWNRDSVDVRATVARGSRLYFGGSRTALKLGVEAEAAPGAAPPSELVLRVPAGARVWLKSATASAEVDGITGEVDVSTVSGNIRVRGEPSLLAAESMEGSLDIGGSVTVLKLKAAGGEIRFDGSAADVSASTVSGDIHLTIAGPVATGRVESVTGSITWAGEVASSGSLDLQTHGAHIQLALPRGQDADIDVSAFSGKVMNGFPSAQRSAPAGKPVRYVLGAGGAHIAVRSLKGGVTISALP
jgi:phage baseplate assembly protein gpV